MHLDINELNSEINNLSLQIDELESSLLEIEEQVTNLQTECAEELDVSPATEFGTTSSGTVDLSSSTKADLNFFKKLAEVGSGEVVHSGGNDYYLVQGKDGVYAYDIKRGKLRVYDASYGDVKGKIISSKVQSKPYSKGEITVDYYYPSNLNLNDPNEVRNLTTTTTLFGSGGNSESYIVGNNSVFNQNLSGILIWPHHQRGETNYFANQDYLITSSQDFIRQSINQNSGVKNSILGASDGAITAMRIAAGDSQNNYNSVVCINGYLYVNKNLGLSQTTINNLKKKEIIFVTNQGDQLYYARDNKHNHPVQSTTGTMALLHEAGVNFTVVTNRKDLGSSNDIKRYLTGMIASRGWGDEFSKMVRNIDTSVSNGEIIYIHNSNLSNGHGRGCGTGYTETGLIPYFQSPYASYDQYISNL